MRAESGGRTGFAIGEVVVAVFILCMCFIPVLLLFSSTRTDTSRGVHRLRAMELINETIDWITICPRDQLQQLAGFVPGAISAIPVTTGENQGVQPFVFSEQAGEPYAEDYQNLLKRDLIIKPCQDKTGLLQEAEVSVTWSEGGHSYTYGMAVLIADESGPDY